MPYKESPHFETPCRTKKLWRFMHIDKFMSMLIKQSLYFPKITVFGDHYEGELSDKSRKAVYETSLLDEKNTPVKQDDEFREYKCRIEELREGPDKTQELSLLHTFDTLLTEFSKHLMFCNSWFQNDNESHTMWAEYGDKSPTSIAIQTTVGDLINCFESSEVDIHIGAVEYIDYDTEHIKGYEYFTRKDLTNPYNVLELFYAPIMHKRKLFADEHEVRAVISFESICNNFLDRIYTSEIPFYSDRLFEDVFSVLSRGKSGLMTAIPQAGFNIDIYLDLLINAVVLSPYSKDYFDEPLRKLMDDNKLSGGLVRISRITEVLEKVAIIEE